MQINIRSDSVEISGYVNAVERDSNPLRALNGRYFIERICKGAFKKALNRGDDVKVLLNHDSSKELGSTKAGNLELNEDNIGLHARATITDKEVIDKARKGDLVGWSFGFRDIDVDESEEKQGMAVRAVKDLDLKEVSILDRTRTPAYDGTLLMTRAEDECCYGETLITDIETRDETHDSTQPEAVENKIDYSKYEAIINECKTI